MNTKKKLVLAAATIASLIAGTGITAAETDRTNNHHAETQQVLDQARLRRPRNAQQRDVGEVPDLPLHQMAPGAARGQPA
jgi:hypothetical protein